MAIESILLVSSFKIYPFGISGISGTPTKMALFEAAILGILNAFMRPMLSTMMIGTVHSSE
jgi:uncharacterized membrane protein YvlD (DUF360 family)